MFHAEGFLMLRAVVSSVNIKLHVNLPRDVPFRDGVDNAANLRGKIPQMHFGGVNRHFKPNAIILKPLYCQNYCIDSNQIFYNDKHYQMLSMGGPNMHTPNPT